MEPVSSVRAVVFDLGNVLIDFDHTIAAKRIAPFTDKTADEIYRLFFDSPVTGAFEEGSINPADFFAAVQAMLGARLTFEEFLPIWNEIFFLTERNKRVYEIAMQLRAHYTVALLSNVNILHWEYIRDTFELYGAFHHLFASCVIGARKPSPTIFNTVLETLALPAHAVFYTDDRADLIAEASLRGFRGFIFTGPEQLERDLASVGIRGLFHD